MKYIFTFLAASFFLLLSLNVNAQNFVWADPVYAGITDAVMDNNSNSFITGEFIDSAKLSDTSLYGSYGTYIAKYNTGGRFLKVITLSTHTIFGPEKICYDQNGSLYIFGEFTDTITLGTAQVTALPETISYFVAKLDTSLNCIWLKAFIDTPNSIASETGLYIKDMACDKNNGVYLTGICYSSFLVDTLTINNMLDPLFILKLDGTMGIASWVRGVTSNDLADPAFLTTDTENNVLLIGDVIDENSYDIPGLYAVFNGVDTVHNGTLGYPAPFLAKYDRWGNYQWVKVIDTAGGLPSRPAIDMNNNIFMSVNAISIYTNVLKYNSNGALIWSQPMNHRTVSLNISSAVGTAYMSVNFTDTFSYMGDTITAPGEQTMIIKFDTLSGNMLWNTQPISTNRYQNLYGLLYAQNGNLLVTGRVTLPTHFSSTLLPDACSSLAMMSDTTYIPLNNNTIKGNIYNDADHDCLLTTDAGLSGFSVMATPGPYYAVADVQGNYTLKVDTGIYTITQLLPIDHAFLDTQLCPTSSYTLALHTSGQTDTGYNFPNNYSGCGLLKTSIVDSTSDFFLCGSLHFSKISVVNLGVDTVNSIELQVQYPYTAPDDTTRAFINPLTSSPAWTIYSVPDSLVTFSIGSLPPNGSAYIVLTDTIMCYDSLMTYDSFYAGYGGPYHFGYRVTPLNSCYPADTVYNNVNIFDNFYVDLSTKNVTANLNTIQIFPNPTFGTITVKGVEEDGELMITSMMGVKVYDQKTERGKDVSIDMSSLPPAIYVLTIRQPGATISKKIVKSQ